MAALRQIGQWPVALERVVTGVRYKGWALRLEDVDRTGTGPVVGEGLTLSVLAMASDSYSGRPTGFLHYFPVPPMDWDERSWTRWVFDQLVSIETHEAMEAFQVDGTRPFAPSHAPGSNPYVVRELGTEHDQRADYRGMVPHA